MVDEKVLRADATPTYTIMRIVLKIMYWLTDRTVAAGSLRNYRLFNGR
jgi:hypothetical protein